MRPKLKVSPFEPKTLVWWKNRRSQIDMNPSYQRRGRLWSDSDKAYLIDSIINGFDVPKLYVADFTWGDSPLNVHRLPYAIIDGKQRFEAIFDFFDGRITLNDDFVFIGNPALKIGGLGYKDLQENFPDLAEVFDNYSLSVMSVFSISEELIDDLFVRLNRSKPLTGAEIRNAMAGPAPKVIRRIAQHEFFITNVCFSVKRGADLNAASKALMFEFDGKLMETKKRNLDEFVRFRAREKSDQLELAARRVIDVLEEMAMVFLPKDRLLSSAGIFPVYYWLIRDLDKRRLSALREFLVRFEEARTDNRRWLSENPQDRHIDQELVQFESYSRSPNDAASYEGRYRILRERFLKRASQ